MAGRNLFAPKGRNLFAQDRPNQFDLPPNVGEEGELTDPTPMLGEQSRVLPFAESMAVIGSGAVAEPLAGASSLLAAPFVGSEAAAGMVDSTRDRFTFQPRTRESQRQLQNVGEKLAPVVEPVTQAIDTAADKTLDATGSPLLATLVKTAPVALAEIIGLKGISLLRPGTRLLTPEGAPSRELEVMLNNKGLTFEGLTPEARQVIPEVVDRNMIRQLKTDKNIIEGDVQKQQLLSGGREGSLAKLEIEDGNVVNDPLGINAIKKGWRESTVQMAKTSNASTKKVMNTMLNMRWSLLKSDANAGKIFPMNAVGDSFHKRIKFITNEANKARVRLNNIAKTKLSGVMLDPAPVVSKLKTSLDDLGIGNRNPNPDGIPSLDFSDSIITKNKPAQKAIKDAIDLMSKGKPDAARFHKVKQQLDDLIDFKKKSGKPLTEKGRNVLKGLRHEINQSLRKAVPEYAEVNDVMSSVLGALDEFKAAAKIDLNLLDDPTSAIGQEMRKLHTNYKSRTALEQSAARIDKLANDLGGSFTESYTDLAQFANRMDERFGSSKSGDFQGKVESGTGFAQTFATEGKMGVARKAASEAGKKVKKMAGPDEFDAFQAMKDILNK